MRGPRTSAALPFAAIMSVLCAGMFGISAWTVIAGACLLALYSLASSHGAFAYHQRLGLAVSAPVLLLSTCFNATAASGASYLLGRVIGWAWGIEQL
jgi:hypothetical protein